MALQAHTKKHGLRLGYCSLVVALTLAFCGCSTLHYVKKADKEVYDIISQAGPMVKNMDPAFSIEREPVSLEGLPTLTEAEVEPYLGEAGKADIILEKSAVVFHAFRSRG